MVVNETAIKFDNFNIHNHNPFSVKTGYKNNTSLKYKKEKLEYITIKYVTPCIPIKNVLIGTIANDMIYSLFHSKYDSGVVKHSVCVD